MDNRATAEFAPEPSSLAAVRAFIREACPGLDDLDLLKLITLTNELATNAVVHVGSRYRVTLITLTDGVRIEVHDRGEQAPILRRPAWFDKGGRGLLIVDRLARDWGIEVQEGRGKIVWAELETPSL